MFAPKPLCTSIALERVSHSTLFCSWLRRRLPPLLEKEHGLVFFVSWFGVRNALQDRPSLMCPPTPGSKSTEAALSPGWPRNRQIEHMLRRPANRGIKDFLKNWVFDISKNDGHNEIPLHML